MLNKELNTKKTKLDKIGRNDPCPCGSGLKFKKCCLKKFNELKDGQKKNPAHLLKPAPDRLEKLVSEGFDLLAEGKYQAALKVARKALIDYPEDDRFYDMIYTANLSINKTEKAEAIAKKRFEYTSEEKKFYIEHGRHRSDIASYYYAPETWLNKYYIAQKATEYRKRFPRPKVEDTILISLVNDLMKANDLRLFPNKKEKGLKERKEKLSASIEGLKKRAKEALPYLLPHTYCYSWVSLLIPEIIASMENGISNRLLIDQALFGFPYASQESLSFLEKRGERVLPYIADELQKEDEFDRLRVVLVGVLGNIPTKESCSILVSLLKEKSEVRIVEWAAESLVRLGYKDGLEAIKKANERFKNRPRLIAAINQLSMMKDK